MGSRPLARSDFGMEAFQSAEQVSFGCGSKFLVRGVLIAGKECVAQLMMNIGPQGGLGLNDL